MTTPEETINMPKICLNTGEIIELESQLINKAVFNSLKAHGNPDRLLALKLSDKIMGRILLCKKSAQVISIDDMHDVAEFVLIENGQYGAAREYKTTRLEQISVF